MDFASLILVIVGALNWLLVGLFQFDVVAAIFGSSAAIVARIIYVVIGLAWLWAISFFTKLKRGRNREE